MRLHSAWAAVGAPRQRCPPAFGPKRNKSQIHLRSMMGRKQKPVPPTRDLATDRMKILEICQETYSHLFTGYSQKAGMPRFSRSRSRGQGQLGKESGCPYPRVSAH